MTTNSAVLPLGAGGELWTSLCPLRAMSMISCRNGLTRAEAALCLGPPIAVAARLGLLQSVPPRVQHGPHRRPRHLPAARPGVHGTWPGGRAGGGGGAVGPGQGCHQPPSVGPPGTWVTVTPEGGAQPPPGTAGPGAGPGLPGLPRSWPGQAVGRSPPGLADRTSIEGSDMTLAGWGFSLCAPQEGGFSPYLSQPDCWAGCCSSLPIRPGKWDAD